MPLTIYPSTLKIKDGNGTFHGADCLRGEQGPQGPQGSPIDVQVNGVSVVDNDVANIDMSDKADKVSNATSGNFASLDANGNLTDSGTKASDFVTSVPVTDVQIDGTSILNNGVASIPVGSRDALGAVKWRSGYGIWIDNGYLELAQAIDSDIKAGTDGFKPIQPAKQHIATFYGLAKATGDTSQASSSNPVGSYTETARSRINYMLNEPVNVSGANPVITGKGGIQYVCGEVETITLNVPQYGIFDVIFTSGTTPTVLTLTGASVTWPSWFNPNVLEANTTYEINVKNNLGVVAAWT